MSTAAPSARRSLVSGGTYAVANAAQRALGFILLPVYTAVLTPAEYGRLGLLLTIQSGAVVAFSAGMEAAAMRTFFQFEGDRARQDRFIASAWNMLLIAAPVLAAIASLVLLAVVPRSPVFRPGEAVLALASAASFVGATVVPLTVLRAEQRLRNYVALTAVTGVATVLLTVLFVVILGLGVAGWFTATLLANVLTLVAAMVLIPWHRPHPVDREGLRAALKVGLPLMPHAASHWSLQLADRLVLSGLVAASALGVYTLGANLALPALVLVQSLNQGFMPSYGRRRDVPGAAQELRTTMTLQILLVLLIGATLMVLGPAVVGLLGSSYAGASALVPWLVLGYVFLGLYFIPMNVISLVAGRTTFVWLVTIVAAAVNLGLIVALVPSHGIKAAAIASAVGYLVLWLLTMAYARALRLELSIDWRRIVPMSTVVAGTVVVGAVLIPDHGMGWVALRAALIATLPLTLAVAAGYSPRSVVARARSLARSAPAT